ncbi:Cytoplasmic protein [Bacillus albus]
MYALSHIDETFAAVEQAISDSWNQDVVNGDWNSRAKWYGNVEMQVKLAIAELFVGTKGVDKVSTLGKTSKLSESVNFIQGTKNVITLDKFKQSVDMLNNILMPKNQFAYAGANNIRYKFDTPDFHRVEEKLSTHQFAKGEVSSSGNKGTGKTVSNYPDDIVEAGGTRREINSKLRNPLDNPKIAKEIEGNTEAVYGYSPKKESALNKFGVDWTNGDEVAYARSERIKYHEKIQQKRIQLEQDIKNLQNDGLSMEEIARLKVEERNQGRMETYIKSNNLDGLNAMKERNILEYGRAEGPTPEQLYKKYGSWEDVIYGSLKTNPAMDVLTGLFHSMGGK